MRKQCILCLNIAICMKIKNSETVLSCASNQSTKWILKSGYWQGKARGSILGKQMCSIA